MASAKWRHNRTVRFSTTFPIIVDVSDNLAVQGRDGKARTSYPVKDVRTERRAPECCGGVRMWDGVMKFAYAWTFAGEPRGETPAPPPGKPAPALPRLPACHALFRQTGTRIFQTGKRILRAMLAVFRTGRRQRLAFGDRVLSPASTPRRPAKTAQPPPVIPAFAQGMPWKHGSGSAYRTVRAGLLGGPVSPYHLLPARTGNPMHNAPPGATHGASPSIAPPHCPETRMLSRPERCIAAPSSHLQAVNFAEAPRNTVNARTAWLKHAHFREFFLVLGRFLYFKAPIKYR